MVHPTKRRVLLACISVGIVLAAIVIFGYFVTLDRRTAAIVVFLVAGAELLKAVRWALLLRSSGLQITVRDGVTSYLGAQALSAIPGGPTVSIRLAGEHGTIRSAQAAASIIGERVADFVALGLLSIVTLLLLDRVPAHWLVPGIAFLGAATLVVIFKWDRQEHRLPGLLPSRYPFAQHIVRAGEDLRQHANTLLSVRGLRAAVVLSILTSLVSTIALLMLVSTATHSVFGPVDALYVHVLSTTVRLAVPAPGGLGVGDMSIAGVLAISGVRLTEIAAIVAILRSTTVIVRTSIGLITFAACYSHMIRRVTSYLLHRKAHHAEESRESDEVIRLD
jgi:putative heme transporter